ncbi:MAG: N-acetyl-gamma-glutamyl-phosphate reductase [Ruminococcus sp.]|nr:N-acetyl-gamma-glutamyl-phosphate reductase [Ruminococcus sp.]
MSKKKIFIDGREGTTGLGICARLENRDDIELIILPEDKRKDPEARKKAINASDVTILCLPDAAAKESVSLVENPNTIVLDASTAHRTADGWVYGLPELSPQQLEMIKTSKRVAVPGCHASGFITLVAPLVKAGIIGKDALLTCHSITGYSGGGKKMIADYEADEIPEKLNAPRQYGLTQSHKHLPEMVHMTGLENAPIFCPIVSDFYSGMLVTVPLFKSMLLCGKTVDDVKATLKAQYDGSMNIEYVDDMSESGFLDSNTLSGTDKMQVSVCGNDERMLLVARYDNLGKGASGAAAQCLELILNG